MNALDLHPDAPPDGRQEMPEPVTAFVVDGRSCLVIADDGSSSNRAHRAGGFTVAGRQYVILLPQVEPDQSGDDPLDLLTRRELEIAVLVAAGKVTKEIAQHLRLSVWTVSTYLRRSFSKLHVATRAELAARIATSLERRHGR